VGDSVPRGTNCSCAPYPPLTATGFSKTTGDKVTATNDSVVGYTTKNVLNQLNNNQDVIDHLKKADVVGIEIGANDVGYNSTCGTSVDCYAPKVPTMKANLLSIVRRTQSLVSEHKHVLVLLDYWSVWLGGKYAANKGQDYVAAAEEMTDRVDSAIQSTALKTGSAYVDLRAAFKGPSYSYDETRYLSNDGDHPNAAGHQKIESRRRAVRPPIEPMRPVSVFGPAPVLRELSRLARLTCLQRLQAAEEWGYPHHEHGAAAVPATPPRANI
jgi:acyl-CoA thioesterase I